MTRDEDDARVVFAERYGSTRSDAVNAVEREVIGGDWGANGYTTTAQADEMGELVGAGASTRLLDVGAGRGWPGLYLAASTGCRVVLTDLPLEGLRDAVARARDEGLSQRTAVVVASAARLPFASATFDAVVSSDTLC